MNILIVLQSADSVGGTERTAHLAAGELRNRGHRVVLLEDKTSKSGIAYYDAAHAVPALFDRRASRAAQLAARRATHQLLLDEKVDVVHVHAYPTASQLLWMASIKVVYVTVHTPLCPTGARYLWGPRCVCERSVGIGCFVHGYLREGCGRLGNGAKMTATMFGKAMVLDRQRRHALSRCSGLIVPSEWARRRLKRDGFPSDCLHVIYPPIERANLAHSKAEVAVVLFVGRLVEIKGISDLIKAVALISLPYELWIVGDGPQRSELEQEVQNKGLEPKTTFFGSLLPDRIADLRARAAIAVMPSRWPETFGMAGPEAMASGLPVISYDGGAVSEWLQSGINGIIVPLGNISELSGAMESLLNDGRLRSALAEGAIQSSEAWSIGKHVDRLLQIYSREDQ